MISLNKEAWEEMWKSVKKLELHINEILSYNQLTSKRRGYIMKEEVEKIKELIQSVIGQME